LKKGGNKRRIQLPGSTKERNKQTIDGVSRAIEYYSSKKTVKEVVFVYGHVMRATKWSIIAVKKTF
jgi:hypothetical protein